MAELSGHNGYKYFAFISYSHQDNVTKRAADSAPKVRHVAWADWLHTALESYRIPKSFMGRQNSLGEFIPASLFPCFQDEKEFPTSPSLKGAIESALSQSRYLIVVCSPNSACSEYVNAEVKYFKSLGRADRVLPIIVAGEPNVANKSGFSSVDECFCEALRYKVEPDGTLNCSSRDEPICADARWGENKREVKEDEKRLARAVLDNAKLKLIAGLIGVSFDVLAQREHTRAIKRRRRVLAAAILLILVISTLAIVAGWQRSVAVKALSVAENERSLAETQRKIAEQKTAYAETQKEMANKQTELTQIQKTRSETREAQAIQNNRHFADFILHERTFFVTPAKQMVVGTGTSLEFQIPVNVGCEYFFLAIADKTVDIEMSFGIKSSTGVMLGEGIRAGGILFFYYSPKLNDVNTIVLKFIKAPADTAITANVGRRLINSAESVEK